MWSEDHSAQSDPHLEIVHDCTFPTATVSVYSSAFRLSQSVPLISIAKLYAFVNVNPPTGDMSVAHTCNYIDVGSHM